MAKGNCTRTHVMPGRVLAPSGGHMGHGGEAWAAEGWGGGAGGGQRCSSKKRWVGGWAAMVRAG